MRIQFMFQNIIRSNEYRAANDMFIFKVQMKYIILIANTIFRTWITNLFKLISSKTPINKWINVMNWIRVLDEKFSPSYKHCNIIADFGKIAINKVQGQTIQVFVLNLENSRFSHGHDLIMRWKTFGFIRVRIRRKNQTYCEFGNT